MDIVSLGFRTDLMLRRMSGSEISDRGSHLVIRTPANPLYWWGNFLLVREVPAAGEWAGWIDEFEREFPGAEHVAIGLNTPKSPVVDGDELRAHHVDLLIDTVLTATGLSPATPVDAEIRPLCQGEDWAQMARLRLSLQEGPADPQIVQYIQAKAEEFRGLVTAGRGAWFGAFIDGTMRSGAGLFTDGQGVARYQSVETHPDFRRRGLASALVQALGRHGLEQLGAERLVIVADPGYHAIDLYRALGFKPIEHQVLVQRAP